MPENRQRIFLPRCDLLVGADANGQGASPSATSRAIYSANPFEEPSGVGGTGEGPSADRR
jgi:hypothetical protein